MIRGPKPPSQGWRTFLENHAKEIIAADFFTVPTATFRVLFVFIVLSHDRREIIHTNVTDAPNEAWAARQILEATGLDHSHRFLIRDRDVKFGSYFSRQVTSAGVCEVVTSAASPWQNAYAERVIGTFRRECLDHMIILGERHLRRTVKRYADYYNRVRTHLSLDKDSPKGRLIHFPEQGSIHSRPHCGGLHHAYLRKVA